MECHGEDDDELLDGNSGPERSGRGSRTKQSGWTLGTPPSPLPKAKWYYVVARGRIPGVYTDWGQAEQQVNGYLGALHKKFQDQLQAKKFMRDNHQSDNESEGGRMLSKQLTSKVRLETGPGLPPLEITTLDPSISNSKALFGMMLSDE